jgi:hypothetical protein
MGLAAGELFAEYRVRPCTGRLCREISSVDEMDRGPSALISVFDQASPISGDA